MEVVGYIKSIAIIIISTRQYHSTVCGLGWIHINRKWESVREVLPGFDFPEKDFRDG
jgi:hypothetical protein